MMSGTNVDMVVRSAFEDCNSRLFVKVKAVGAKLLDVG